MHSVWPETRSWNHWTVSQRPSFQFLCQSSGHSLSNRQFLRTESHTHTDNTTLTTSCGHQAPVVVSDVYDLNKFPRVDLKSKHILQCGGLQASHVGEKLKQQHLCCTDDVVTLFETKLAPDDDSLEHMHRYLPTFLVPPFLLQILKKLQCS